MNTCKMLKTLGNDTRLNILSWLREPARHFESDQCDVSRDGVCVGLIEKKAGVSQSTVSHYLKQLEEAGFVTMERRGQWTYCRRNESAIKAFITSLSETL